MKLLLTRLTPMGKSLGGTLTIVDGPVISSTLENAELKIPAGTYSLCLTYSPRFRRPMPLICPTPGRSGIRIHAGTKPEHSLGCVLVPNQQIVERIIYILQTHEHVTLTIAETPKMIAETKTKT